MLISISGTAATAVSSIKVGGTELMSGATVGEVDPVLLAGDIAAKITQNGYTATASGSTVTITPTPTSTPVITKAGDMIFTVGPVCSWGTDGNPCNWPIPGMDNNGNGYISNIDDLWHAAVNGHGQYFSATSPTSLSTGLSNALATIASRKGSSAAAATSTLNPVAGNNYAYVASYTTVKWQGNLEARTIDVNTGVISDTASWCVESIVSGTCPAPAIIVSSTSGSSTVYYCQTSGATSTTCPASEFNGSNNTCNVPMATSCTGTMPGMVSTNSDTRTIYTSNGTALIPFDAAYASANPSYFSATGLSQWSSLTATQQSIASGTNLVNYLRGQTGYENRTSNLVGSVDNRLYRYREATLGDALESQPIFIAAPVFSYADPGYTDFKTAQASRPGTIYMGANDGMLHAFSALDEGTSPVVKGGTERWAYVPSMVIPHMWQLADNNYATQHANFVNGSPIISDICTAYCDGISGTPVWKTILVGGLNAGGRGYFALDITNPAAPTLLWEFTTTSGQGSTKDDDLGYSYGNPVITAKADGTWVVLVTSGYNNTSPGNGKGYLYVLNAGTGAIISKIGTGAGDSTTPSGLAKISAWSDSSASNRASYVYGGDLLGNVWRFDINGTTAAAIGTGDIEKFATLLDPSGGAQPITTAPVLGQISKQRIIFVGTGKYLETADLNDTQVQSEYALKDDGSIYTNPAGSPRNSATLVQQTLTTAANGTRTTSSNPVDFSTDHGWYVDFPDSGERSNIESRLVQGTLLVATIVPSNTVCSPGGYGWLNFFDYKSGGSIDTSGLVSVSYDNSIVGINVLYINGAPIVEAVTSNNPTPTVNKDVLIKPPPSGFSSVRLLWRELNP
jgi:type IV pilus assembly protein PilY1